MNRERWKPVTTAKLIGFGLGVAAFFAFVLLSQPGFVFLLDHANLLFHEAGHPIVGLFSSRLEPYGGTIGQLTFPVVLAISFWRKGLALSFAGAVIWFFENCLNIAHYMADARTMQLPLVGGGDHDWNTIFSRWHLLPHDTHIVAAVKVLGWCGMGLACAWVAWHAWRNRRWVDVETDPCS